jgi:hypothetical protein
MSTRRVLGSAVCVVLVSTGLAAGAGAQTARATTTRPATGGNGVAVIFGHTSFDLASVGYTQAEFLVEGTADAYTPAAPLTSDGHWTVAPTAPADFTTRIVVNRPIRPRDFNGTVIVEWLNVSGGADASPDWIQMHNELIRQGYAWVGVSAQAVGMNSTKGFDPVRYEDLAHPGDSYSYDMFSQAGQAVLDDAATVLGGLRPRRLLGVGESQSATRLTTYINAVHPLVGVYEGFLVHSRGPAGAPLSQPPLTAVTTPNPSFIRDDLDVPVLVFQTENDLGLTARQDDTAMFRLWEVAGTAHFDLYGLQLGATDTGARASVEAWFDSMLHPTAQPIPNFTCATPINSGPQTFVLRTAIRALDGWVADGRPPPHSPRFETISVQPVQYAVDANGNVLGGIRTPAVDAPVAKLNGLGQTGASFCFLFGITVPFTPEQLAALYGDHGGFVSAWVRATRAAERAGFLLPEDARQIRTAGARSEVLRG